MGICLDESRRNGAPLPVTALVDQFYAEVQKLGGGRWDTSSLMRAELPEASALRKIASSCHGLTGMRPVSPFSPFATSTAK